MPGRPTPQCAYFTARTAWSWRSPTTGPGPRPRSPAADTALPGYGSGSPSTTDNSTPRSGSAAASPSGCSFPSREPAMTTVLIADDQALVRVGLRKILENEPETVVVGEAGDGQDTVAAARRTRPDVVLMDIRMPVLDGIEATRRIVAVQPATRVLILTTFALDDYVYDALRAGASGFMLKDAPPEEIVAAVRIVASGEALLAPAVTRAVIEEFTRIPARRQPAVPRAVGELTAREREVLDLLIRGLSNPEICRQLVISEATAKTHVARILQKLGLRDRVQAVIYAYESGLVTPGPAS